MRNKRLIANTASSLVLQVTVIVTGIIIPKLILEHYGSTVNGLVHSITQFLQIIAFLELGVGAVVQSSLYKPLSEKNMDSVSRIIVSANRFFKRIAVTLVVYAVVLIVVYPRIATVEFDYFYISVLIFVMSLNAFSQYYFGIVDGLLLNADQRGYIQFISHTITQIVNLLFTFILIKKNASIQMVKLTTSFVYLLRPLFVRIYINKHYKINRRIEYGEEPIKQKWNGIAQHIAAIVLNQTDIVVLTFMRPIAEVSVYSVYSMVAYGIKHLFLSLTGGVQALIGELWAKNELTELNKVFGWLEWIIHNATIIVFGCAGVLIVPFVMVYTKGIEDANYYQPIFAILITMAHAAHCLRLPNSLMILACGHYKQTQWFYVAAAALNVIISVLMVGRWGLNGVAIGTLIAMIFHTVWMTIYNSKNLLKWPLKNVVKQLLVDLMVAIVAILFSNLFEMDSISYLAWTIYAIKIFIVWFVTAIIINTIFYRKKVFRICHLIIKN